MKIVHIILRCHKHQLKYCTKTIPRNYCQRNQSSLLAYLCISFNFIHLLFITIIIIIIILIGVVYSVVGSVLIPLIFHIICIGKPHSVATGRMWTPWMTGKGRVLLSFRGHRPSHKNSDLPRKNKDTQSNRIWIRQQQQQQRSINSTYK